MTPYGTRRTLTLNVPTLVRHSKISTTNTTPPAFESVPSRRGGPFWLLAPLPTPGMQRGYTGSSVCFAAAARARTRTLRPADVTAAANTAFHAMYWTNLSRRTGGTPGANLSHFVPQPVVSSSLVGMTATLPAVSRATWWQKRGSAAFRAASASAIELIPTYYHLPPHLPINASAGDCYPAPCPFLGYA